MLGLRVIRPNSLEIPTEIKDFTIIRGEKNLLIALQVYDLYNNEPFLIESNATTKVQIKTNTRTPAEVTGNIYSNNRSIVYFILSETNIDKIISGGIKLIITKSSGDILIAYNNNLVTLL